MSVLYFHFAEKHFGNNIAVYPNSLSLAMVSLLYLSSSDLKFQSIAKNLAKCPGKVRANERNVTCYNFSASAAELNGYIKSLRGILRCVQDDRDLWVNIYIIANIF